MKAVLKLFIIPLIFVGMDLFFRGELLTLYSRNQLLFYSFSVILSVGFFVLLLQILKLTETKPFLFYVISLFVLIPLFFSYIGSYAFFSLNGIFPNYYTLLYFKTEPKSAMMIIRDVSGWKEIIFFLLGSISMLLFMRWFVKNHVSKVEGKFIFGFSIVQLLLFEVLISQHQRFDQCAIVDANFAACVQRNAFSWDEHTNFQGKGLSVHFPAKLTKMKAKSNLNVIVFVFESFRKRSLQLYGHKRPTTPALSKFAKENPDAFYRFDNPISIASTTMLAVPAIMTGIGPYQDSSILYNQPMIFEMGQQLDYRTFFLSSHTLKWYRFDRFYSQTNLDYLWNKDNSGLPYFNDLGIKDVNTMAQLNKQLRIKEKPFFGVIQLNTTHFPFHVPKKEERWNETFEDSYDNAVRYQDKLIGQFLQQLKKQGLLDNTAVFFVSDHGESLMEHHNIGHAETNYTETISIPLMAYIPPNYLSTQQKIHLKKNQKRLTSNIDIAPSILELLHLSKHPSWENWTKNYTGFSLLSPIPSKRKVISLNNNQITNFNTGLSVATEHWHYLFRTNIVPNRQEFYMWRKDKKELKNVISRMNKNQKREVIGVIRQYPVCAKYSTIFNE
jgi:glucan phosphoethanolaminetransferase (alkaline phosphatase superfamily)